MGTTQPNFLGPLVAGLDQVVPGAGGELHLGVERGAPVEDLLDRLLGEVDADPRPVDLGLAGAGSGSGPARDDVWPCWAESRPTPSGKEARPLHAGSPASECRHGPRRQARRSTSSPGRGSASSRGFRPWPASDVNVGQDVVDDLRVCPAGIRFRRDVFVFGDARGDHEAAVDVGPLGRDREVLGGFEDQVGVAQGSQPCPGRRVPKAYRPCPPRGRRPRPRRR